MVKLNTRVIRYEEDGTTYEGTFVEQSRVEITKYTEIEETLVNEGVKASVARQVASILESNDMV